MSDNLILNDYAGTPRHRWHQLWLSPDVPRMCPEILLDRYTETGPLGRTLKSGVDLTALPTRGEWSVLFPEPTAETIPIVTGFQPPPEPSRVRVAGYPLERVRHTPIPPIEIGAWNSVEAYDAWVGEQRKLRDAMDALSAPFETREGTEIIVLMSLRNLEPILDDDQTTRIDAELWWERIELYAPLHPVMRFRSLMDARNDVRPPAAA